MAPPRTPPKDVAPPRPPSADKRAPEKRAPPDKTPAKPAAPEKSRPTIAFVEQSAQMRSRLRTHFEPRFRLKFAQDPKEAEKHLDDRALIALVIHATAEADFKKMGDNKGVPVLVHGPKALEWAGPSVAKVVQNLEPDLLEIVLWDKVGPNKKSPPTPSPALAAPAKEVTDEVIRKSYGVRSAARPKDPNEPTKKTWGELMREDLSMDTMRAILSKDLLSPKRGEE